MFSYRHSLNGREAAAQLQRRTCEHYMGSAQLNEEVHTEVICWLIYHRMLFSCTDILSNSRKNCNQVSGWKMRRKIVCTHYKVVTK